MFTVLWGAILLQFGIISMLHHPLRRTLLLSLKLRSDHLICLSSENEREKQAFCKAARHPLCFSLFSLPDRARHQLGRKQQRQLFLLLPTAPSSSSVSPARSNSVKSCGASCLCRSFVVVVYWVNGFPCVIVLP